MNPSNNPRWKIIHHVTCTEIIPLNDAVEHGIGDECPCAPEVINRNGTAVVAHRLQRVREEEKWAQ